MKIPQQPKLYHIVHVDKLRSIISDGMLWCDREVQRRNPTGTPIGLKKIKERRLGELHLTSYPDLFVGDCVPFYFCPRSVMLFMLHQGNATDLNFRGGQEPIVHLQSDLHATVAWANENKIRWAFTLSNAGAYHFEDRSDLAHLREINWKAVEATSWAGPLKEGKQAEFLVEKKFPWTLVEEIGVLTKGTYTSVVHALPISGHRPPVEIRRDWYY